MHSLDNVDGHCCYRKRTFTHSPSKNHEPYNVAEQRCSESVKGQWQHFVDLSASKIARLELRKGISEVTHSSKIQMKGRFNSSGSQWMWNRVLKSWHTTNRTVTAETHTSNLISPWWAKALKLIVLSHLPMTRLGHFLLLHIWSKKPLLFINKINWVFFCFYFQFAIKVTLFSHCFNF